MNVLVKCLIFCSIRLHHMMSRTVSHCGDNWCHWKSLYESFTNKKKKLEIMPLKIF